MHCARQHVLDVCQRVGGLHDIFGLERRPELVQLLLKQVDAKGTAFGVGQRRLVHDWRAEQAVERRDVLQDLGSDFGILGASRRVPRDKQIR